MQIQQSVCADADSGQDQKVLAAVAQELADLSEKNRALQSIIKPLLACDTLNTSHMIEVQSADMLTQHLSELAKFLSDYLNSTSAGDPSRVSSALDGVVLGALAERLGAICLGLKANQAAQEPVEFF